MGELERLLELGQPAVSQQLARLRQDRLVVARREGRVIYYRASREHIDTLLTDLFTLLGAPWPCDAPPREDDGDPLAGPRSVA